MCTFSLFICTFDIDTENLFPEKVTSMQTLYGNWKICAAKYVFFLFQIKETVFSELELLSTTRPATSGFITDFVENAGSEILSSSAGF